jgi:hypothetical protein
MHQQIRLAPVKSPADLEAPLRVVADAGINILAVGGSNVEHGGEFGFAVDHDKHDAAIAALRAAGYKPRTADVTVCFLEADKPGQLLDCVAKAAKDNKANGKGIRDIAVGIPDDQGRIPVQIYSDRRG